MNLADYDALSFDCYGTLRLGNRNSVGAGPLRPRLRARCHRRGPAGVLRDHEEEVERENPTALYPEILAEVFRRIGASLGATVNDEWANRLGASVPSWPAFPDSPDALASLAEDYKLIIVSDVHREDSPAATFASALRSTRSSLPRTSAPISRPQTISTPSTRHLPSSTCRGNACCTWRKA